MKRSSQLVDPVLEEHRNYLTAKEDTHMLETLSFNSKMDRKCVLNKNLTMIYKWIKPPAYSFDALSISYHHSYQRQFICFIQPFSYREFFTIHFLSCFCCWDVMTSLTKHCNHIFFIKIYYKDTVGKSVRLDSGGLGVRIPAVTDQSRENR